MNEKIKKIIKKVILILTILLVSIAILVTLPFTIIYLDGFFIERPPKPEIKYGEFPFELVYTVEGETIVVEDVVICEYAGSEVNGGSLTRYRVWDKHLLSNNEEDVVLVEDGNEKVYFYVGDGGAYMGDYSDGDEPIDLSYEGSLYHTSVDGTITSTAGLTKEELKNQYNIEIISFKPSPSIENNFK